MCWNTPNQDYSERLKTLDLESWESCRNIYDLSVVYKMHNGFIDLNCIDFFEPTICHQTRACNTRKLQVKYARLDIRKYFFSNRIIYFWNKLPENVVSASNVTTFIYRLKQIDKSMFKLEYTWVHLKWACISPAQVSNNNYICI